MPSTSELAAQRLMHVISGTTESKRIMACALASHSLDSRRLKICVQSGGIDIGLTTFNDTRGECRLSCLLNVKHNIEAKESCILHAARALNALLRGFVPPGIYPASYSGTRCLVFLCTISERG